jgi:hypothetical protein
VAVNWSVVPGAIEAVTGVTPIDTNVAAVAVSVAEPLTEPNVAVIVAVPGSTLVASPIVEEMVATVGALELHCTLPVMSWVLPSLNVPVAVNCCVTPSGSVGIAGVTAIETRVADVTVTFAEPLIEAEVAVTPVPPIATLLAAPRLLTVAMLEFALLQVAVAVRSRVLPSLYVPVAANCRVVPKANDGLAGVTAIETSMGWPTVSVAAPVMDPELAVMVDVPTDTAVAKPPAAMVATVV